MNRPSESLDDFLAAVASGDSPERTRLLQAIEEFRRTSPEGGRVISMLEGARLLDRVGTQSAPSEPDDAEREEPQFKGSLPHFFQWLLYAQREIGLAYAVLQLISHQIRIGIRSYWAVEDADGKRRIAWESDETYPGTDSNIWNTIAVDD